MSKRRNPRHSENCPVKKDTEEIVGLGVDMVKALRRLRRDLQACERCGRPNCGILETFHTQVDVAIQELNEEWGVQPFTLASSLRFVYLTRMGFALLVRGFTLGL